MKNKILIIIAVMCGVLLSLQLSYAQPKVSIFTIVPGLTASQVEAKLGKPQIERRSQNSWLYRGIKGGQTGHDDPTIFFDKNKQVKWLMGSRLELGGKQVLKRGESFDKVNKILGKPSRATHDKKVGTSLYKYDNHKLTIVVADKTNTIIVFALGRDD